MRKELTVPFLTFALGCFVGAVFNFQPTIIVSQPSPIVLAPPQAKRPDPIIVLGGQQALPVPAPIVATLTMPANVAAGISDQNPSWKRTRPQGVLLNRMFVSEDGRALRLKTGGGTCGDLTDDHRLIARVVMNNAESRSDFRGWADVMRFLSPHVTASKELTRPRQRWTSTLPGIGDDMPSGWIDQRSVEDGEDYDGDWRVHGPCWSELRKNGIAMWVEGPPFGDFPKDVKPSRWGNDDDVINFFSKKRNGELTEDAFIRRERFCVVPYGDLNFFIARNGRGCTVGDEATVAAYQGLRPEQLATTDEELKPDDVD